MRPIPQPATSWLVVWLMTGATLLAGCSGTASESGAKERPATLVRCPISTDGDSWPTATATLWRFTDDTDAAGLGQMAYSGTWKGDDIHKVSFMLGSVVGGDLDNDCWPDLVLDRGDEGLVALRNQEGRFYPRNIAGATPNDDTGLVGTLALADINGDGWDDIFAGAAADSPTQVFLGHGAFAFVPVAGPNGLTRPTYGAHFFDVDSDGDLDLFAAHWVLHSPIADGQYLFINDGDGSWSDATESSGLASARLDNILTPRTADLNRDGLADLLLVADFGRSRLLLSTTQGEFVDATGTPDAPLNDENGMGSATGDIDNDGDIDWFVSAIFQSGGSSSRGSGWGVSGNRLYRNVGAGVLEDQTDRSSTRRGGWGWGACMHDFDLDGYLDIFHVNGWPEPTSREDRAVSPFLNDRSVLFVGNGDGTFDERSAAVGLNDDGQGRGIVCADFDRDGDVDIVVANYGGPHKFYRNHATGRWLSVQLRWRPGNHRGVGARIVAQAGELTLTRHIGAGSNYMSHDPPEAHFGLAEAATVDRLTVHWPDATVSEFADVAADQSIIISAD